MAERSPPGDRLELGEGRPPVAASAHEPWSVGDGRIVAEVQTSGKNCVARLLLKPIRAADGLERNVGVRDG